MPPKKAAADAAAKAGGAGTAKAGDPEEILLDVRGNASFALATFLLLIILRPTIHLLTC